MCSSVGRGQAFFEMYSVQSICKTDDPSYIMLAKATKVACLYSHTHTHTHTHTHAGLDKECLDSLVTINHADSQNRPTLEYAIVIYLEQWTS